MKLTMVTLSSMAATCGAEPKVIREFCFLTGLVPVPGVTPFEETAI